MVEIREAPVPVRAWDVHKSGNEVQLLLGAHMFERFIFVSMRPLKVLMSNGQTVIVRAKK